MEEKSPKVIPVMVALRCRPLIQREKDEGCQSCLSMISGEPQVVLGKDRAFTYDFAFGPSDPQVDVYNHACSKLIKSVFRGYNATILAYGQTGSGKTFTMGGYEASLECDEDAMGVIPRTLREVFRTIEEKTDIEVTARVSYMEIYKEELKDLLCSASNRIPLSVREENNGEIKIQGLTEVSVQSFDDTIKLLSQGAGGRTVGATAMNSTSSRSHAVFTLHLDQKTAVEDIKVKFHMVDLAGSERCKRTMAEGERLKEGININKGLLALGNVISALGDDNAQKRQHIPYRDSKLTRILQDSLGGNSHTLMIACVSPADSNIEETLNTLRYADRARKIKNKPIINRDPQVAEIMRLKTLVQSLQSELINFRADGGNSASTTTTTNTSLLFPSAFANMSNSNKIEDEVMKLKERVKELESETAVLSQENHDLTEQLHKLIEQSSRNLKEMVRLEEKNEKLRRKVNMVKDHVGIDLELLSTSMDTDRNPKLKAELEKLQKLTGSIKASEDTEEEEEEQDEEEDSEDVIKGEVDSENKPEEDGITVSTPSVRAATQRHAKHQAELQEQLGEINRMLSNKQALAEKMEAAEEKMEAMKSEYEEIVKEYKAKTSQLEKEKEELASTLVTAKSIQNANKVAEQRRQRLKELEQQMSQLKKKMAEQSKIVKMKESTDKEMGKLGGEILALKQQRVKLMKQMKEEASSFQKWKKEKEKQVSQLQLKDRKREVEMSKMKRQFEQQQAVQKRRTAEAMAANKRLREALTKQKEVETERSNKLEKCDSTSIGNRVRKWLSHELEVKVSVMEAQFYLEQLMDERKRLTQYLNELNAQLQDGPITEKFSWLGLNGDDDEIEEEEKALKKHIQKTELDIELINAQIQELQQKIVDGEQESKGTATWQSLHSMVEAKCAMKFLLSQAISARSEHLRAQGELRTLQDRDRDDEEELQKLKVKLSQERNRHQNELKKVVKEKDDRIHGLLITYDNFENHKMSPRDIAKHHGDVTKALATKLEENKGLEVRLSAKEQECEDLRQRLLLLQKDNQKYLPDLLEQDSDPNIKVEGNQSADLNSTFNVPSSIEDTNVKPEPEKKVKRDRNARRTVTIRAADVVPEEDVAEESMKSEEDANNVNSSNEENRPSRGRKARSRKTVVLSSASVDEEDDEMDGSLLSSSLKRRSSEDPESKAASKERKKKRRTLLNPSLHGSFFGGIE